MPIELISRLVDSVIGFIPIGLAARTSLIGVLIITVAGGVHEYRNQSAQLGTTAAVDRVANKIDGLATRLIDMKQTQDERHKDDVERMDRIEKKVDDLLAERRVRK